MMKAVLGNVVEVDRQDIYDKMVGYTDGKNVWVVKYTDLESIHKFIPKAKVEIIARMEIAREDQIPKEFSQILLPKDYTAANIFPDLSEAELEEKLRNIAPSDIPDGNFVYDPYYLVPYDF